MHLILLWRWTTLFAAIGVVVFSPSARSKKVCTDACLSSERDGSCDDGMQRSSSKWCQPGSDCSDCGPRELPDLPSKTYVVQRGDTLNKIGETNGVTADSIAIRNSIPDPAGLEVGQVLMVTKAAFEEHEKNTVGENELRRRKRLVAAAKDLAYERLFGKKRYTEYVDAVYSADNSGDKKPKKKFAIPILILVLRLRWVQ